MNPVRGSYGTSGAVFSGESHGIVSPRQAGEGPSIGAKRLHLIINADDFGLSLPLNAGIIRAHREGIVTSTSFIVTTDVFPQSCELVKETPSLDVGIHLVAVGGGRSVLPPSHVRSLLSRSDRFPTSWKGFAMRLALGQIDVGELTMEFEAQIQKLLERGITPTHCDSHQHIHLFSRAADCVMEISRRYSIPFVRAPKGISAGVRSLGINFFSQGLREKAADRTVPSYGFDFSGHLDRKKFLRLLDAVSSDTSADIGEIIVHPGYYTDVVSWGYDWEGELSLLTDSTLREEIVKRGAVLTGFGSLRGRAR